MATIGQIGEFVEGQEECYIERVEQFFKANEISEEKQVAVLLTVIGASTYSLLKSLLAPQSPSSKNLETLVNTLKNHFSQKQECLRAISFIILYKQLLLLMFSSIWFL